MQAVDDTIAALATPPGRGGISILRLSGARACAIAEAVTGRMPAARHATLCVFRGADGSALDQGLALYFPAPHSFTGEDVVELHGHGSPVLADLLLARVYALGARPAEPGEFSLRAFLNDRLDLVQAEAIADLVASRSAQAARAAMRSLDGDFSARVRALVTGLISLRVHVEAAIDFADEDLALADNAAHAASLTALAADFEALAAAAHQGRLLGEGLTVVIAGPPNAGKSSLLNALAGAPTAIVTALPGTTRDVLREQIVVRGMPLNILDTAGLRASDDVIEQEGIRRTHAELARADHALLVVDITCTSQTTVDAMLAELPAGLPRTLVCNKADLLPADGPPPALTTPAITISALTGQGLEQLRDALADAAGLGEETTTTIIARRRHLDALARARAHLDEGERLLADQAALELLAEELRLAQHALGEITGEVTSDELLGRIFSSFCIGK
ncbi:MAG: tRNA uridine-5-carboxymethylaminomethyl(34) synthesis GTPase MnmE [Gammaproteobacteria bacterium]|nr:tRNA uridine-5-carboxymethylaminomethyl(34) synthesis GTPase MnmE [Gammaproteobacteria bacterium]